MSAQFSGDSMHNLVLHKSSQGLSSPPWEGNVSGKKRDGEEAKKKECMWSEVKSLGEACRECMFSTPTYNQSKNR